MLLADVVVQADEPLFTGYIVVEAIQSTHVVIEVGLHEAAQIQQVGFSYPRHVTRSTSTVQLPGQRWVRACELFAVEEEEQLVLDDGATKAETSSFFIHIYFRNVLTIGFFAKEVDAQRFVRI